MVPKTQLLHRISITDEVSVFAPRRQRIASSRRRVRPAHTMRLNTSGQEARRGPINDPQATALVQDDVAAVKVPVDQDGRPVNEVSAR